MTPSEMIDWFYRANHIGERQLSMDEIILLMVMYKNQELDKLKT